MKTDCSLAAIWKDYSRRFIDVKGYFEILLNFLHAARKSMSRRFSRQVFSGLSSSSIPRSWGVENLFHSQVTACNPVPAC
jgi:hypothetical protein